MHMTYIEKEKFDQQRLYLLTHKIKNVKDSIELDDKSAYKGPRYHDDERIASAILIQILEKCGGDYELANAHFLSLNHDGIMPYIKEAVIYSAESDYWYRFEKDYGYD